MAKANKKLYYRQRGIEYFNFDVEKELISYSLLCGQKISGKQRKNLQDNCMFDKYSEWKDHILQKYQPYSKDSLSEFSRYLNLGKQIEDSEKETYSIVMAAFFSSFFSSLLTSIADGKLVSATEGVKYWCTLLSVAIAITAIVYTVMKLYFVFDKSNITDKLRVCLYQDYKEIIDEMISERKKEHFIK